MYARHKVGVIIRNSDRARRDAVLMALPEYVDAVYSGGNGVTGESILTVIPGSTEEAAWLSNAYRRAIGDQIDVTVITTGGNQFEPKLLPKLLDPIIWEQADMTRCGPNTGIMSEKDLAMNERDVFAYRNRFGFSPDYQVDSTRCMVAVSRDGLELLRRATVMDQGNLTLVAIPCFNEQMRIGSVVLSARPCVDEVLVVDDGSTDASARVAEQAGATVIRHSRNRGYGGAVRTCFEYARERNVDVMVVLDGDGQHEPTDIPDFLRTMQTTGADIVVGSRFLEETPSMPLYRKLGIKGLDIATSLAGKVTTTDSQSGYRAYGRRAIERIAITDDAMGAGSEILSQAGEHGLTIAEVPIRVRYDLENTSSQHPLTHGFDVLSSVLWRMVEKRPLSLVGLPGMILILIGFTTGILSIQDYLRTGEFIPLSSILLASGLLIIGMTGLFTGLSLNLMIRVRKV